MTVIQEFINTEKEFKHRLKNTTTDKFTAWAGYTTFTYLDGIVGFSAYYGVKEGILNADEFCKMVGIT